MHWILSWFDRLLHEREGRDFQLSGKWFLLSILLGMLVGISTVVFDLTISFISAVVLDGVVGAHLGETAGDYNRFRGWIDLGIPFHPVMFLLVITAGGLISGFLMERYAPEAIGSGMGLAIQAFHEKRGHLRWQTIWVKQITTAVTLGTGGSGGREGPIAQIGAALGAWLSQKLHLTTRDRRILLAAGIGAGVGAMFRAPLAGALFAAEILYREADFEAEVVVPAAMASIISYGVHSLFLPEAIRYTPLFGKELQFNFLTPFELIPYTLLAIALIVVGMLYTTLFARISKLFNQMRIPVTWRVGLGAFLSGLCAIGLLNSFQSWQQDLGSIGTGYGALQSVLTGKEQKTIGLLLAIVLGKILSSS
ncbi:MAG: chloride channel protein, partial [Planctomycetaceae bacterium]|nr:chloride channel protein [Planctomycetaceae bacterium]